MGLEVIILAAGQGTRMRSSLPKVLHKLAGKPMLLHVAETAQQLGPDATHIVVGHKSEQVQAAVNQLGVNCVYQAEQLGTGHAVGIGAQDVADDATILMMYGDVPLMPADLMQAMVDKADQQQLVLLTVTLDNAHGYGRIVRNSDGNIEAIVEQKDASPEQQAIKEINTGIMAMPAKFLRAWLPRLQPNNAQNELYITDVVEMAVADGIAIDYMQPEFAQQTQGVNDQLQLAELERWYQQQQATSLMRQGAQIADPSRIDVRGELSVGSDVFIDVNCVFEGKVSLGNNVHIGPNCVIKGTTIAAGTKVKANSVFEDAIVGEDCDIGPFARLRPGTELAAQAKVGNFVETKKTYLGKGSKANHFTYLGDTTVGEGVNIGAGTITCNYDGVNKFRTEINDGAFIGSNSSLVAPVIIGAGATVGAGSTVTKEVPADSLAIARSIQRNRADWPKPTKQK